jgi:hypothetical protein
LKFEPQSEPVSSDQEPVREQARVWSARDHKHAFTITREHNVKVSPDPFFVVHTCQLDGSYRRQTNRNFKTFDAAVHRCSIYTREARRQAAYHEAGHAVTAHLLGFTGVWVEMDDGANRAITRHDLLPSMLAVANASSSLGGGGSGGGGGHAILARYQYEELMYFVAGTVAEVKIAGYPEGYVEEDTAGRPCIEQDAIRVARVEAGLPICGHGDCEIPLDTHIDAPDGEVECGDAGCDAGDIVAIRRVTGKDVAEVIKRAEDEVFVLLKANWRAVLRVVNALCKHDRITSAELDEIIKGTGSAGKRRRRPKRKPEARHAPAAGDAGSSRPEQAEVS